MKHTKGPWKQSGTFIYSEASGELVAILGNRATNTADSRPLEMRGDWQQAMADARLIAAAPDLLEALESALKTAEFEKHAFRPWQQDARAAISKARGES